MEPADSETAETSELLNAAWRELHSDPRVIGWDGTYAVRGIRERYSSLSWERQQEARVAIAAWLNADDDGLRWDARVLVREMAISEALPELVKRRAALDRELGSPPDAHDPRAGSKRLARKQELKSVSRLLAELTPGL